MNYTLNVVKTKTGWVIKSNLDISSRAGAGTDSSNMPKSERSKDATVNRAYKLALNLSKESGVTVTVAVFTATGKLQYEAEW